MNFAGPTPELLQLFYQSFLMTLYRSSGLASLPFPPFPSVPQTKPPALRDPSQAPSQNPPEKTPEIADSLRPQEKNPNKRIRCNCTKTNCLKLYCECLNSGEFCDSGCRCYSCRNNEQHPGVREQAVLAIKLKNPSAFNKRSARPPKSEKKGCNCRQSKCLKKYCECFLNGVFCDPSCKCENCRNRGKEKDDLRKKIKGVGEKDRNLCEDG